MPERRFTKSQKNDAIRVLNARFRRLREELIKNTAIKAVNLRASEMKAAGVSRHKAMAERYYKLYQDHNEKTDKARAEALKKMAPAKEKIVTEHKKETERLNDSHREITEKIMLVDMHSEAMSIIDSIPSAAPSAKAKSGKVERLLKSAAKNSETALTNSKLLSSIEKAAAQISEFTDPTSPAAKNRYNYYTHELSMMRNLEIFDV